jgi:hypothetical protein
MFFAFLEVNNA